MQRLILASNTTFLDIPELNEHLDLQLEKAKILYITTASNKVHDISYVNKNLSRVRDRNLIYEIYDIEGKSKDNLDKKLSDFDILHMEGGNTFHLLKTIYDTGFDKVLKKHIKRGLNYIGTSAGSYVMTPSIITATWNDRGFDRCGLIDLTALSYVPFVLKCHYTEERKQSILDNSKNLIYPLKILKDGQAIAVHGDKYKLIGEGSEITLEILQNENV